MEPRGDPYRELLRAIVHQQLAGAAARAIERRFIAPYRGRYPKASDLLAAKQTDLRAAGLSRQKIAALRAVAEAFHSRRLENRRLRRMDDDAVIEAVTQVRGIGTWTAHMLLMFTLGRPDVLPVGDFGVRKGAMLLYELGDLPKPKQLEAIAEPWRPYRSVASWYLWRAADTLTQE
jgi:DNA-3-methyladenine glycosylase II